MTLSSSVTAQTISWNKDVNGTIEVEDTAGLSAATYWNNSFPEDNVTNLFDSLGAGTTLDIVPAAPFTYSVQNTTPAADSDGTSNKRLLNGYLNAGASASPAMSSVALSQIPFANYNIYVYFSSDVAGRSGTVNVGSSTYSFNALGAPSVSGANAVFAAATPTTTIADAANYALFTGLSGESQTITVDIPDFGGIAGFQVVNTGAVTAPFRWISTANNQSYSTGSNWFGGASPNSATPSDVVFGAQIDGNKTVFLNESPTFSHLNFNNSLGEQPNDGDYFLVPATNQTITLAGAAEVYASGRHWLRTTVQGTSGLKATGPGQLILDAVNTFSGGLTVEGGSVALVRNGALPVSGDIALQKGGELSIWGVTNGFFVGTSGAPGFGTGTISGNVALDGGLLTVNDGANLTLTGAITGTGAITLGGTESGGELTLGGANSFTGQTRLFNDSVLTVSSGSSIGASDGTQANGTFLSHQGQLVLSNAALGNEFIFLDGTAATEQAKLVSQGDSSISGNIYASNFGGSQFEISSAAGGTLALTGTLSAFDNAPGTSRTYVFSGDGSFSVARISDAVVNNDGVVTGTSTGDNVNVVKRGTGTMTVTTATSVADDYWQKSTVVEQGVLKVESNGSGVGELQSRLIDVKQGGTLDVTAWQDDAGTSTSYNLGVAQVLAGGGTINAGSGTLGTFGDNVISPGDGIGTLSVTGNTRLAVSGTINGGALNFQLGNTTTVGGGVNDLISVSGTLTTSLAGGTMAVNAAFDKHAVASAGANYTVMTYASSAVPAISGILQLNVTDSKGNSITSRAGTSFGLTANSTSMQVQVIGNSIGSRTWTGAASGAWSKGATGNWSGGDNQFFDFDPVTFGASATNKDVTLAATVSPGAMTINGGSYTFSGEAISAPSVSVTGASTVASFANTLGGDVTVSAGATLASAGTLQDNITVQSGSKLRIGGANLTGGPQRVVSWNVDNNGTIGGDGAGSLPPLTALAGVVSVGGWSNTFPDNPTTDLRDDLGAATTLDIAPFSNSGTWNINNFAHAGQDANGTWDKELLTGYVNSGSPNGPNGAGVVISQIPYSVYDVIAYFNSDNDTRTGTVTVGGTTYSFKAAGSAGSYGGDGNATFAAATASTTTSSTANYAVFSGLSGATQTITVNIPSFGGLAGFQVVRNAGTLAGETMNVLGDLSLESGATAIFNIGASGVNDRLIIGGNLGMVSGSIVQLVLDGSVSNSSLVVGSTWDLFDFATASGTINSANFLLPTLSAGLQWNTSKLLIDGSLSIALAGLTGDYNGNGVVDAADYTVWRDSLGQSGANLPADGDGNGTISQGDYVVWTSNFGAPSLSFAKAVPEPATVGLVLLALGFVLGRRGQAQSS